MKKKNRIRVFGMVALLAAIASCMCGCAPEFKVTKTDKQDVTENESEYVAVSEHSADGTSDGSGSTGENETVDGSGSAGEDETVDGSGSAGEDGTVDGSGSTGEDESSDESGKLEDSKIEVIMAGSTTVYLDEVRYYAYNTQATYEAYYMAQEAELDWTKEMSVGVSLEEAVKSTVLDRICEREAIVECAEEYQVSLSAEEWTEVHNKVDTFFDETNSKLLDKINVTEDRLVEIFGKDALFEKVKEIMESEEAGKSESVYKNWKIANNVTTNEYWNEINYKTPIFMSED